MASRYSMLAPVVGWPVYSSYTGVCHKRNRPRRTGKLFSNRDKLKKLPGALVLLKYNPGRTKTMVQRWWVVQYTCTSSRLLYSSSTGVCSQRNRPWRMGKIFSNRGKLKKLPVALTLPKYNSGTTKINDAMMVRTASMHA
jgi:hypothetical protein